MKPIFSPIAIVGRGCLLPGALTPRQLWQLVVRGRNAVTRVPEGYWRIDPRYVLTDSQKPDADGAWCDRGGYVTAFESVFDPRGFAIPAETIRQYDPLVHWVLHTAREALGEAGADQPGRRRTGAVFGNLSYPSHSLNRFAESVWLRRPENRWFGDSAGALSGNRTPAAVNRFSSGLPAHVLSRALNLEAGAFALDAACASSLYAIKLACDFLHDGRADLMLAGGVNRADDLTIHIGFCLLQAMSKTGRSRPLSKHADGLVPAEGAGFVALKRLDDAVGDGNRILGVIRGVGLSNDGRGDGLLAPSAEGQVRAITQAYAMSGVSPGDISLVEAHATGTQVGDRVEIQSMSHVFQGLGDVPIGSIKSNIGHPITVSGIAGLLKVLDAMQAGIRPATPDAGEPLDALNGSPFRLVSANEPWTCRGPRRAVINNFGFGGNNAHLIVEQWRKPSSKAYTSPSPPPREDIAIVGLGAMVADVRGTDALARALFAGERHLRPLGHGDYGGLTDTVDLPLMGWAFSPADLDQSLAQQLLMLKAATEAINGAGPLPRERTGVLVGMGCDAEAARCGLCWRLADPARRMTPKINADNLAAWLTRAKDRIKQGRQAATILGAMPNIVANRLCRQFDLGGPAYTVSAEEISGIRGLTAAMRALRARELDAALVGAVDLCCEPVHLAAAKEVFNDEKHIPGDAAVALVIKRLSDARREGRRIYAVLPENPVGAPLDRTPGLEIGREPGHPDFTSQFGHAHAAAGLVSVVSAILACHHRLLPKGPDQKAADWTAGPHPRWARVHTRALGGRTSTIDVMEYRPATTSEKGPDPSPERAVDPGPSRESEEVRETSGYTELGEKHAASGLKTYPAHPPEVILPPWPAQKPPTSLAVARHGRIIEAHNAFLAQQSRAHQAFLASRQTALAALARVAPVKPHTHPPIPRSPSPDPGPSHGPTEPRGPSLTRQQLKTLARGKISEVFGPLFKQQDGFLRQVRLPEPPLLLADRVTGIDAPQGAMGKGVVWTETDVTPDAWYLHDGHVPPGILVEAGQCDLLLISWLGADLANQGRRVYRLLGCDLSFHGGPPEPGDTLCYQIHVDGYANVGDTRIFFFHFDCRINGRIRLSVRHAQAGFFSDDELAGSRGILWSADSADHKKNVRVIPPPVRCTRNAFSTEQVKAFSQGRAYECFGPGFERAATHSLTPKIQDGPMLLIDRVTDFDPNGGPWSRGYLRVENMIREDAWYMACHFKNDPCMPGTLMSEACLQAMCFYLAGLGYTLDKDGWRFEPAPDETFRVRCRGQVTPRSRRLTYEVFVEEIITDPYPTLYADILATCDGLKILHTRRMGVRLAPDWPMERLPELPVDHVDSKPTAVAYGISFNQSALLACALGRPSRAFGDLLKPFDDGRHIARLPAPPYHFINRTTRIDAPPDAVQKGRCVETEYDVPADAWYFNAAPHSGMPLCVLMEIGLQPCGWLSMFEGLPLSETRDMYFRNLDGTATVLGDIDPGATVRTRVRLNDISRATEMILVQFDILCLISDRPVFKMQTGFGYFSALALANQTGLPATALQPARPAPPSDFYVDLTSGPQRYVDGPLGLPSAMLLMLDRVTGFWARGGQNGLGRLRAEKTVNIDDWFFKAHFLNDPVQPGSLGVESMVQLLQFYMIHTGMHDDLADPRFSPVGLETPFTWKYRGQVTIEVKTITVEIDIMEKGRLPQGRYAVADAWLWADNLKIFHVQGLKLQIIGTGAIDTPPAKPQRRRHDTATPEQIVRSKTAALSMGKPGTVRLSGDSTSAVCDAMPFNVFPLATPPGASEFAVGDPVWNPQPVVNYYRRLLGIGAWFGEDLFRSLYTTFVQHVILENPAALEALKGKSALYLGNHQVLLESLLFSILLQPLSGNRTITIADAKHRHGWLGAIDDLINSYPGVDMADNIVYFDQNKQDTMLTFIKRVRSEMTRRATTVFLHAEGRLGLACRRPVTTLSAVFIDLALAADIPIIPVRFARGLPVKPMAVDIDFPLGYTRQNYYIGTPIPPEALADLPYAERKKFVMEKLNSLGPPLDEETPGRVNPDLKARVRHWMTDGRMDEAQAVMSASLEAMDPPPAPPTQLLIQAVKSGERTFGDDPIGRWLAGATRWFLK